MIHDSEEINYKNDLQKVSERILVKSEIPNFVRISNADKFKINNFRLSMLNMLLPMDRVQAKIDFMAFAEATSKDLKENKKLKELGLLLTKNDQEYYSSLKHFS